MMPPLYIRAVGSLYFDATSGHAQPDLKTLVQQKCRKRFRRIDRFTQLALIGAARCAGTLSLASETPVYLATGKGPAGINIDMQQAIIAEQDVPRPVQFINAVSNSVSFYVMQDHDICGQNLLVSREQHAFEAALTLLGLDFQAQRSSCALLGMVDELTHPLVDQCARLGVPADTALGEGSHWFLCEAQRQPGALACIRHNQLLYGRNALLSWLAGLDISGEVFFAHGMQQATRQACIGALPNPATLHGTEEQLWDGLSAGAVARFISNCASRWLLSISCDTEQRYHVLVVERLQDSS